MKGYGYIRLIVLTMLAGSSTYGQWATQELALTNGQNAIFMTVSPSEELDDLFAGTSVTRVQCFNPVINRQFEVSPNEPLPRNAEWLYWDKEGASENSMVRLYAGKGYLVEVEDPVTLTVTGKVTEMRQSWKAGEYQLAGFEVKGTNETFEHYLADVQDSIESIEMLREGASNVWVKLEDWKDTITEGESYFVKPSAPIDHAGPFHVSGGLYFAQPDDVARLTLKNGSQAGGSLSIKIIPSLPAPDGESPIAGPVLLKLWQNFTYEPISPVYGMHITNLSAGSEIELTFAINGQLLSSQTDSNALYASVLRVEDDTGVCMLRPIIYTPSQAAAQASWPCGLWVGRAELDRVTYLHGSDEPQTNSTAQRFPIRLIVHNDTNGQVRLLSRVVGVPVTNEQGNIWHQLRTDDRSLSDIVDEDGVFRISSPAFGLMPPLLMSGKFLQTNCCGTNVVAADSALNPYRHQYNPQLTNGLGYTCSYELIWSTNATMSLSPWNPNGTCYGRFRQTIQGLRSRDIVAEGDFFLERVSNTGGL